MSSATVKRILKELKLCNELVTSCERIEDIENIDQIPKPKKKSKSNVDFGENKILLLRPIDPENLFFWKCILYIKNPDFNCFPTQKSDLSYDGHILYLIIQFPDTYPNKSPVLRLLNPICHCNIELVRPSSRKTKNTLPSKAAKFCLDILTDSWSPILTMPTLISHLFQFLNTEQNEDSPLNIDFANLVREGDLTACQGLITYYKDLADTRLWDLFKDDDKLKVSNIEHYYADEE